MMGIIDDKKKKALIFCVIASVFCLLWMLKVGAHCEGKNWVLALPTAMISGLAEVFTQPFTYKFNDNSGLFAFFGAALPWIVYLMIVNQRRPTRVGEEQGSSRWATIKEMTAFKNNKDADSNLVFSKNTGLAVKPDKTLPLEKRLMVERNCNVAVIGGSGSGKTRFYVKPNLMQCHGNYFITDPKGTCIEEVGHLMEAEGYEVKMFNVIPAVKEQDENGNPIDRQDRKGEMDKSLTYNPLAYVKTKEQIPAFVNCLIKNTNGDKKGEGDPFWENAEKLLYIAILSFMQDWLPKDQFTLPKLCEILRLAQASESDENLESPLDRLFQEVETGYCYVPCDRNDDKEMNIFNGFKSELAEGFCVLTKQVKKVTSYNKVDDKGTVEEVTTFLNKEAEKDAPMDIFYDSPVAVSTPLHGCGELKPKQGYIDVPSALTNNITGFSAWSDWYKHVDPDNEKEDPDINYKWDKNDYQYREDFCVLKYQEFKKAAGETLKSIIISCNVRLTPIAIPAISRILSGKVDENGKATGECEMELDKLGDPNRKICTFAIMSDTNDTYFFLVALMMYQAMDALCNKALTDYGGKLPTFVHFVLDEFANLGVLPDFNRTIAITRSRNIGVSMILQTPFQLEQNYSKEVAKVIIDNCDTMVYLGGGSDGADTSTCKEISARLGKETIINRTYNTSRGGQGSTSESNQIQARELMMPDEVSRLERNKMLLMIKNTYPYCDIKYVLEDNPRYAWIDPLAHNPAFPCKIDKNFNFEEYQKRQKEKILAKRNNKKEKIKPFGEWQNEQMEKLYKMKNIDDSDQRVALALIKSNNKAALEEFYEEIDNRLSEAA